MLRSQSGFVLPLCFLVPSCKDRICKTECALHPLSTSENQHHLCLCVLIPAPCVGLGPCFFVPLVLVGWGPGTLEAEAPTSICCVTGSRIRSFAEPVQQPEPLYPAEHTQSKLALHNSADKIVMGSHIVTTWIPISQPTCVEKQRVRWDCQLMKFPSHYLFLIEAVWVMAMRANQLNPQVFLHS